MTTYELTLSTNNLGLGVLSSARTRIEKRRVSIADTYPPINNLVKIEKPTNNLGIAIFLLEPDDLTTYHVAKVFDSAGILIYERFFSMPPSATSLDNTATGVLFGNSNIQFKDEGNNRGTPSSVRNVDFVGAGVEATFEGDTLRVFVQAGSQGFVAITDITPTNPSDNVGNKTKTDDKNVLQSCTSSTNSITVHVLAVTAGDVFKPVVNVNGVQATLTRNAGTDVWVGTAAITLVGTTVTATHNAGAIDTATVTIEAAPVINSMTFSKAYPNAINGQTEHAAGQKLDLTITSPTLFDAVEVIYSNGLTATTAIAVTEIDDTLTHTLEVTVADQGSYGTGAPLILPAKARIRNLNGTWSNVFSSSDFGGTNGTHILALNNTRPSVTFGSIVYPMLVDPIRQLALKVTEEATVNVTYSNADTALWSSTELIVSDPTVLGNGNKVVNRNDGVGSVGYNISTDNLQVVLTRTANATTATFSTVVWIADDNPVITKTLPAARLRSGVSAQSHVITLGSDQRLISIAMNAGTILGKAAGTFPGSWATANNGLTNTRTLVVADSDPKGTATFTGLSAINLAGKEVTTVTTNLDYVLGGFIARTVTFPLWDANQIREVAIGTNVSDTSKLVAFNVTRNRATTYRGTVGDEIDKFTITGGNTLYNCDLENASTAITSPVLITIEETVA
jgi:hypothetical protein